MAGHCSSLSISIPPVCQYGAALAYAPFQGAHEGCGRVCSSRVGPRRASGMVAGYASVEVRRACAKLPSGRPLEWHVGQTGSCSRLFRWYSAAPDRSLRSHVGVALGVMNRELNYTIVCIGQISKKRTFNSRGRSYRRLLKLTRPLPSVGDVSTSGRLSISRIRSNVHPISVIRSGKLRDG